MKLSSWKLALCLIFWSIFHPRIFLESRCHLPNCKFGEYLVTFSNGFKAAVVGSGLKQAAFLHSQTWVLGQQSLSGSRVPSLYITLQCAWRNPHKCMSHYFFLVLIFFLIGVTLRILFVLGVHNLVHLYIIYVYSSTDPLPM